MFDVKKIPGYIAYARKTTVTVVGLATTLLTLGFLPNPEAGWVATFVAVATAVLNYKIRNADTPTEEHVGKHEAPESPPDN